MSQTDLAKVAGVAQGTIGNLEAGIRKNPRDLLDIAAALGVSPQWLKTGKGSVNDLGHLRGVPVSLTNNPAFPAVRRVRFKLSAGVSGFAVEHVEDDGPPIVFRRDWFDANHYVPARLLAARVSGASMEPTLYDGDTVVINTDQPIAKDGRAFAINYDGEMVIKRMVHDRGNWMLRSDHPDKARYPDKATYDGVSIIGEIVYRQSERI